MPYGDCEQLYVNITNPTDPAWFTGKTWGERYWEPGADRGGLIFIKKEVVPPEPESMGPNPVLNPSLDREGIKNNTRNFTVNNDPIVQNLENDNGKNSLWKLMQVSYQLLNTTSPNLTERCWLCYGVRLPFYEAVGVNEKARRVNGSNPLQCTWGKESQGITLTQVTGKGRCVGQVPPNKMHLCANQTNIGNIKKPAEWLLPPKDARWVCSKIGVTPCLSLDLFNGSVEFCVQVIITPKILYHSENFMYDNQINQEHHLTKREPISTLTVATLMVWGGGGAGVGTGVAWLIKQGREFTSLRMVVDEDLARIEKSI
uniref:Envelope glycoprotein n=1 Tax=Anser cygnoides TaxID=8845 RepID=A0A8B9DTS5_ANSCY